MGFDWLMDTSPQPYAALHAQESIRDVINQREAKEAIPSHSAF